MSTFNLSLRLSQDAAARSAKSFNSTVLSIGKNVDALNAKLKGMGASKPVSKTSLKPLGTDAAEAARKLDLLARKEELVTTIAKRHGVAVTQARKAINAYKGNLSEAARGAGTYATRLDRAAKEQRELTREQRKATQATGGLMSKVRGLAASLGIAAAAYLSIGAAVHQLDAGTKAAVKLESIQRTLTAATSDGADAMAFMRSEADRVGLSLGTASDDFAKLNASALGTRLAGAGVRDIFSAVAETGAKLSLSQDDISGGFKALGQMMSKGTVQAEELRGQLGERIPGAFQIMARALGVSTQGLGKMLEQGQVLAEDALPKFAAELRKTFGTDASQRFDTSTAALARYETAVFNIRAALGQAFLPALLEATQALSDMFSKNEEAVRSLGKLAGIVLTGLVATLGFVADNLDAIAAAAAAVALARLPALLASIATSATAMNAAFLANPLLAVAAAAAVVGVALNALINRWSKQTVKAIGDMAAASSDLAKQWNNTTAAIRAGNLELQKTRFEALTKELDDVRNKMEENREEFAQLAKKTLDNGQTIDLTRGKFKELREEAAALKGEELQLRQQTDRLGEAMQTAAKKTAAGTDRQGEMAKAVKSVYDELRTLDASKRFVKDFGLSLSEAGDAAKLKLAEGVKLADAQVAALIKRLSASKKELAALALVASLAPGNLQPIPVNLGDFGTGPKPENRFTVTERIAELTSQYATDEERAAAAIKEAQKLLGGNEKHAELLRRITEANRVEVETTNDGLERQRALWEKIRNAAFDAAKDSSGAWQKFLLGVSDNIGGILNGVAMLGQTLTEAGHAGLGGLLSGFEQIASGDVGAGIGTIAGGFGLTGGGVSQFGGRNEGNFLAQGAAIGEQFGGTWGAVFGAALGSFFKSGADDMHSMLTEAAGQANLIVTQAEGDLAEVAAKVKETLEGFFNSLQDSLNANLDFGAGGLEFHIREDRVRVVVNGIEQVFHTIEEALAFAAQGVLAANAEAEGLGDNMRALFEHLSGPDVIGSMEQLQEAINLAAALDFEETGVTGAYIKSRERALSIGRQYGMNLEAILALEDKRIAADRRALEAQTASVFGVDDVAGRFTELTGSIKRFDAELAASEESRASRIEEIRAELEAFEAAAEEAVAGGDAATGALLGIEEGGIRARDGAGAFRDDLGLTGAAFSDAQRETKRTREEIEALKEELAALEKAAKESLEALGVDEIGKLWTTAVDQVAVSLIDMIQAIEGPTAKIKELEEIRHREFIFTLYAQIQQAKLVLATMEGVSQAVRAMIEGLISDSEKLLEGLASGDIKFPTAGEKKGGGKAKDKEEERIRAVEDFRDAAAKVRAELEASSPAALEHASALAELFAKGQEAKIGTEELAAAMADLAELQLRDLTEGWREMADTIGQIDLKKKVNDLIAQAREDLATAAESAAANPAAYAAAEKEIRDGLSAALRQAGKEAIDAIGNPMRSLRQSAAEVTRAIRYMLAHLDELGLTAAQVANQVRAAALPDLLDILEKQAKRVGDEEFLAVLQDKRAKFELALEQLKFELLVKQLEIAGAMTPVLQELIDAGRELFTLADDARKKAEDPGVDSPPIVSSSRSLSSASDAAAASFDNLAESIRAFVSGFEQTAVGRFEAQARDWLDAIASFERQIAEALSQDLGGMTGEQRLRGIAGSLFGTTDLSSLDAGQLGELKTFVDALAASGNVFGAKLQELVDILQAGAGLDVVSQQGPQKLLDLYRQGADQADGLADELDRINAEYADLVTALDMMGASADELAEAGEIYLEQLARFWDDALSGVRSVIDELTRGPSSGRAPVDLLADQQRRVQDLAAAAAAGDLDALQQLEGESRTLLDLISQVFGSGAAGGALREELLALLQSVESVAGSAGPAADTAVADLMPASAAEIAEIFRQQSEDDREAERVRDDEQGQREDARARDLAEVIRQEMREGSSRMVAAIREERVRASEDRDETAALLAEATVGGIVSGLRAPVSNSPESSSPTEASR